jgi:2-dehydropantoate 2-reductase
MEHGKNVEIDAILTVIHDIGLLVGEPTPAIDSVLGLSRLRLGSLSRSNLVSDGESARKR